MKYNIILLFLITSCINPTYVGKGNFLYSTKGFAIIENKSYSNLDNNSFVFHNKLKSGTKIKLFNPVNDKSVAYIVKKKVEYNDFYKVLISVNIAEELGLDFDFPYLEINEIKNNKSFIAKKAITESVEKKIANKAPVTKINIDNLAKPKKIIKNQTKTYSILVAEFYNLSSAEMLKKRLNTILVKFNYHLIYINKKDNKSYELLMGPYNTINKLKNDYIELSDSNFEDLDIKIND